VRRQVFKYGIRVGSISPGPVVSALLADWPPEKLKEARESGSHLETSEVANVVTFMLTRPRDPQIWTYWAADCQVSDARSFMLSFDRRRKRPFLGSVSVRANLHG
jgi:NAD(P)-dependent dehydrogenase (short-subunit alcohol dehydrogenase family)